MGSIRQRVFALLRIRKLFNSRSMEHSTSMNIAIYLNTFQIHHHHSKANKPTTYRYNFQVIIKPTASADVPGQSQNDGYAVLVPDQPPPPDASAVAHRDHV